MTIPHVDVHAQYAALIPELKDAFARTLDSGQFIFGPEVEAFEREAAEKLGTADAVSCANGTDAIVLVLDAMGIGSGDEVICPSFTFYATAEAIARVGATPVFADIDPVTLNVERHRAIVLVLDAMGIGPGDEVICPSFTFYATAEAIARRGATPVFADIDPVTLNLDPATSSGASPSGRRRSCRCISSAGRPPTSAALGCP